MTVTAGTSRSDYLGDGVQTEFPVGFQALVDADLGVYLTDPASSASSTKLVLNTDYTVTGNLVAGAASINLVTPPALGIMVAILRDIAISQETNYEQYDDFPADSHERALDKLTMICQALKEEQSRALTAPEGDTGSQLVIPAKHLRANKFLYFGSDGTCEVGDPEDVVTRASLAADEAEAAQVAAEAAQAAAEAAAASIPDPGTVLLKANNLSDLPDKSAARTSLGLGAAAVLATGTAEGNVPVVGPGGKLPASLLPSSGDQTARDNVAMNAFLSWLAAARASSSVPGGGLYTLKTDELTNSGAWYDSAGDFYTNKLDVIYGPPAQSGTANYTIAATEVDRSSSITPGTTVSHIGVHSTVTFSGKIKIAIRTAAGMYDIVYSQSISHPGTGVVWFALSTPFGIPSTGDYYPGVYRPAVGVTVQSVTVPMSRVSADATGSGVALTETTSNMLPVGFKTSAAPSNMTLTSAGVSLGHVPGKATLYLLHKAVDALTLNTDIKVSASRGDGWAEATDLAVLCQYDTDYKLLRASVDLSALGTGSTVSWRAQTYNAKTQQVRAALLWAE